MYGETRPSSTEQIKQKTDQKDQQENGARRVQRPHIPSIGMDPKFEERPFPGGDDRKSGDHEDEIEHVSPIERVAREMLVHGEQNSVTRVDHVKKKGGEPDDRDPGKNGRKQQINEKKPGTRI